MTRWPTDEVADWDGVDARMVFRALDIPWEGATSRELFDRVMGWLEAEERWRRGPVARRPGPGMVEAVDLGEELGLTQR